MLAGCSPGRYAMPPINNASGPVAVTGAAGFIGSHVVKNLVEHGYTVRACVRDKSRTDKTAHLLAMNGYGLGSVEIVEADMLNKGSYDAAFTGCAGVFHVAADLGTDTTYGVPDAEKMYRGLMEATQNVLDSIQKSGSVKRLVYTSSTAAVMGPSKDGHEYTEADWAGAGGLETLEKKWRGKWTIKDNAYAKGKVDCELHCYAWGKATGVDVVSVCPCHVLGPLLCKGHDTIWQHRLGEIFAGRYSLDMLWNITDVRDVAEAQRRMAESSKAVNGSRYMAVSPGDGSGEVTARELIDALRRLFPRASTIGGSKPVTPDRNSPRAKCKLAESELGLRCHIVNDTLKDTIDSLEALGAMERIREKMRAKAATRSKL
mmetsp:Transcript_52514/g.168381  ORF Transcript_52514/g.168381 Transcript_52514/m.168381 type:complete len:374 (+) Transcript_52514:16-1137(+)